MAVKMADVLSPLAKGQNEATRKLIAKALMSSDPVAALAPVLRQEASSTAKRRMIEALIRQPMREIGEGLGR
jgi:ribosomal protein S9